MGTVLDLRPVVPAAIVAVTGIVVLLAQAFCPKGRESPKPFCFISSLTVGLRPTRATVTRFMKKTVSSAMAGSCDWMTRVDFEGSMPTARLSRATSITLPATFSGSSKLSVSAWTSAIRMNVRYRCCSCTRSRSEPQ